MNEFLMVANSLEIKELSKADADSDEPNETTKGLNFTGKNWIKSERNYSSEGEIEKTENRSFDNQEISQSNFQRSKKKDCMDKESKRNQCDKE